MIRNVSFSLRQNEYLHQFFEPRNCALVAVDFQFSSKLDLAPYPAPAGGPFNAWATDRRRLSPPIAL
jgi:hypothetical protein